MDEWQQRIPVQNPDLAWRMVDDECIIIDPQGSQATVLNSVGSFIWELVDGKHTVATIIEKVQHEFEVEPARAEADAREFLEDLTKRSLIRYE